MPKLVDNRADADEIYRKVLEAARKATKYVAHTDLSFHDGVWIITIETDIPHGVGDLAETIIKKSKRGMHARSKAFPGQFDWASDTYIKDQVLISFRF